jgi:hypothetical protein
MPDGLRRTRRLILVSSVLAVWLASFWITSVNAASTYTRDVYFVGAYERQVDGRTCTAASTAMMMNMLDRHDLNLRQMTILRYAQVRDALNNAVQRGSDPLGWSRAATYYSRLTDRPTVYRWEAYRNRNDALNRAASVIAWTGKPVGLLVKSGTHAVVMTGIRTTAGNPNQTMQFTLGSIAVSDPIGYSHRWYVASRYVAFSRYTQKDATTAYDRAWYGNYVIVVPAV